MNQHEITTVNLLRELEIPAHLRGYQYIKTAVDLIKKNPGLLHSVTKELYPSIATAHKTKPSRVERGIRHAISFASKDKNVRKKVLGTAQTDTPNSYFFAVLVESVELRLADNLKKKAV